MESKFHSFWTKFKCRLKNFLATLNQFGQFVQFVQIVGARVFEVMFSVTTVCLVQGKCHFLFYFTGGVLWNHQVFAERLRCTKNVNQWAHNVWNVFLQQKLKWIREQHAMESKFLSFWTKFKCRLKIFVAALTQFGLFVRFVQIVGTHVFKVMFSVTIVCLVQGKSQFPVLLHWWSSLKPPVFISIPIPQAAAPGPRSNRRKKTPPATTGRW